jgi:hypothetical protein
MYDFEFYCYIKEKCREIYLPLVKWTKCLISREFHPSNVLQLWDVIFSYNKYGGKGGEFYADKIYSTNLEGELSMLDFIIVSMLLYIKKDCTYVNSDLK